MVDGKEEVGGGHSTDDDDDNKTLSREGRLKPIPYFVHTFEGGKSE
jgi:hypothetical protein